MVIVQILKRKDAASVVVAVVLALIVSALLASVTAELTAEISGTTSPGDFGDVESWRVNYLAPVVSAVSSVVVLEVLGWIYVFVKDLVGKSR